MSNRGRKRVSNTSFGTGRGEKGAVNGGRSLGPRSSTIPFEGSYKNKHLMHAITSLVGRVVLLNKKSGETFEGVFSTFSPKGDVVLEMAVPYVNGKPKLNSHSQLIQTLCTSWDDVASIVCSSNDNAKEIFKTDGEIHSNGVPNANKELKKFEFEDGGTESGSTDSLVGGTMDGWNPEEMFVTNKEKFNISSTYNPDMPEYTTTLNVDESDHDRVMKADRKAKEIEAESKDQYNTRIDDVGTEEELFSAVIMTTCDGRKGDQITSFQDDSISIKSPDPNEVMVSSKIDSTACKLSPENGTKADTKTTETETTTTELAVQSKPREVVLEPSSNTESKNQSETVVTEGDDIKLSGDKSLTRPDSSSHPGSSFETGSSSHPGSNTSLTKELEVTTGTSDSNNLTQTKDSKKTPFKLNPDAIEFKPTGGSSSIPSNSPPNTLQPSYFAQRSTRSKPLRGPRPPSFHDQQNLYNPYQLPVQAGIRQLHQQPVAQLPGQLTSPTNMVMRQPMATTPVISQPNGHAQLYAIASSMAHSPIGQQMYIPVSQSAMFTHPQSMGGPQSPPIVYLHGPVQNFAQPSSYIPPQLGGGPVTSSSILNYPPQPTQMGQQQ